MRQSSYLLSCFQLFSLHSLDITSVVEWIPLNLLLYDHCHSRRDGSNGSSSSSSSRSTRIKAYCGLKENCTLFRTVFKFQD